MDRMQILRCILAVWDPGFNLQRMCWRIHIFESTTKLGVIYQAIGRVRRTWPRGVFTADQRVLRTVGEPKWQDHDENALGS